MNRSSKKPLSNAIATWKDLKTSNPPLAFFVGKVYDNDIESVKFLSQGKPSLVLEPINQLGTTVLGLAVAKGLKEIVDYLLDNYSDHNFKQVCDKDGNGLLATALQNGHMEIAKRLLKETASGLDVNQPNKRGSTPLGVAVSKNQIKIAELLLACKATIQIENLFICCTEDYLNMASLLLNHMENKSEMIEQQYQELSILHFAIANGNIEFAKLLIKHGANVSPLFDDGETLLIKTVKQEKVNMKMISYLLSLDKIDINAQGTRDGNSALIMATDRGYNDIVNLLLKKGANPNLETKADSKTALMIAAGRGYKEIAGMLIENKQTDIAYINGHHRNALYFAIRFWKPDIINLLLDVRDVDLFQGLCPLLLIEPFIQYYGHKTSRNERLLIQKICNKCTRSELVIDDLIPELMKKEDKFMKLLEFYIAQQEGSGAAIQLDTIKPKGKPLLAYAAEYGYNTIFNKLCQYINNIDQKDPSGRTPLSYAAASGPFNIFDQLVKKGADLNAEDSSCRSILSYTLEGLKNSAGSIRSQCIINKLLDCNVSVAGLTDRAYIALLDFVLQNKKKAQWIPKLNIFDRCIKQIKDHTQVLILLKQLRKEDNKPYLIQKDRAGRTLLSHFAQIGSLELVRELVAQCTAIDMNQADNMGRTPLFYALQADQIAIIERLLQNGADVNHIDKKGCTPLLYAIQRKCGIAVIEMLLAHHADFAYCNLENQGALSYAMDHHNYLRVVDLLLSKMIEEPKCHTELYVALSLAKDKNDIEFYNKLVNVIAPLCEEDDGQGWVDKQQSKKWKITTVSYSMHATQRAKERGIELDAIKQVIKEPYAMQQSKQSDHILKLMDHNICVVIAKQKEKITVITTYRIDA